MSGDKCEKLRNGQKATHMLDYNLYSVFLLILMFMFRVCFYSSAVHSPTECNIKRCMTFTLWMKISIIFGFLYTTLVKNIAWCSFFHFPFYSHGSFNTLKKILYTVLGSNSFHVFAFCFQNPENLVCWSVFKF